MKHNIPSHLLVIVLMVFVQLSCKKDDVITPTPEQPGKQKDIEWPSLAKSAWPMAHHDPQSTGRSQYAALPEGKYQWSRLGFKSWGSTVIDVDGTVYYETDDSTNAVAYALVAVSQDGTVKWKTRISPSSGIYEKNHTSIIISSIGLIYVISRDQKLYAVRRDGTIAWSVSASSSIWSKGLAIGVDGTIYCVAKDGMLNAISADGLILWTKNAGNGFYKSSSGPPIVFSPDGKTLYVAAASAGMYAVGTNGEIQWFNDRVTNDFYGCRLVDNTGNIYATINDSIVCFAPDGKMIWSNVETKYPLGFSMDYDGNLFAMCTYPANSVGRSIISIDQSGKIRWAHSLPAGFVGDLVCDKDGTVYFGSYDTDKSYYAVKNDGTLKWVIYHGYLADFSASPAIAADGSIYVGSGGGGTGGDNGLFKFK